MTIPVDVLNALNQTQASRDTLDSAVLDQSAASVALSNAVAAKTLTDTAVTEAATKLTANTDALIALINQTYRPPA